MASMRIDRILANAGLGSRSEMKSCIRAGRVSLLGEKIFDPGLILNPDQAKELCLDGELILGDRFLYILLNKPDKYLTALEDQRLPTIAELLPPQWLNRSLAPVGRLDYHTTGWLLLTNDGQLSHRLTSPRSKIPKLYQITYSGEPLDDSHVQLFKEGLLLQEAGKKPLELAPALLEPLTPGTCQLTLTEGKTHQVKRMLAAVNRSVLTLHREAVGGLYLENNPPCGAWRRLNKEETNLLLEQTGLQTRD